MAMSEKEARAYLARLTANEKVMLLKFLKDLEAERDPAVSDVISEKGRENQ